MRQWQKKKKRNKKKLFLTLPADVVLRWYAAQRHTGNSRPVSFKMLDAL